MAVKSKLNEDVLAKLGAKKLAELALDEAQRNTPFRRRLSAALAARKGPDAVAAIVDRRLMALERAHGFIDWEGNKAFTEELRAMLTIITDELGKTDPDAAIDRIVRFSTPPGVCSTGSTIPMATCRMSSTLRRMPFQALPLHFRSNERRLCPTVCIIV